MNLTPAQQAAYESWLNNRPAEFKAVEPHPVLRTMIRRAIIDASTHNGPNLKAYPQEVYDAALIHFIRTRDGR